MKFSALIVFIAVTLLTLADVGLTLSLSVNSVLSGSINEDTDGEVIVGYYSAAYESYESSPTCSLNSPSGGLFYLSGSSIRKSYCVACLDYAASSSYKVEVYCYSYIAFEKFTEYASMTVYISPNNPPYFTNSAYSTTVNGFTVYAGQNVYDLNWWDTDTNVNSLSVSYTATATSHVFGNTLWNFNTGSGIITATKTMSEEFTNTYYLTVSVADRRSTVSTTVTIDLNACHITPNCTDQTRTIADTFPIGGTLFTQTVPNSGLFSGLSFSMRTSLSQTYIVSSTVLTI
ncbi:hypothetical protein CHS0354_018772 [Potamilus streckersoni]|uniref:Cadherin domain-containing protein n=1 Tax=Potamilus streckersoni TaxID=2493646 RepID=A0AAE0T3H0_9BIVA|nr:hypothetical protein CHS0354_018772 [Potamilus streckersoni]